MYALEPLKATTLAKKLSGPPVFNDGYVKRMTLDKDETVLEMVILSERNPELTKDTYVKMKLKTLHSFTVMSESVANGLFIIDRFDIRNEGGTLHLKLESTRGETNVFRFESIELSD